MTNAIKDTLTLALIAAFGLAILLKYNAAISIVKSLVSGLQGLVLAVSGETGKAIRSPR